MASSKICFRADLAWKDGCICKIEFTLASVCHGLPTFDIPLAIGHMDDTLEPAIKIETKSVSRTDH